MIAKEFNKLCILNLGDNMEVITMEECGELKIVRCAYGNSFSEIEDRLTPLK